MFRILFYNTIVKLFQREASVNTSTLRHKMCNKLEYYIRWDLCFSKGVDSARAKQNSPSACHVSS
jgi:hypothetical protein